MRQTIAQRMTESVRVAPHVWTSVEVDLDAVERVRALHKERFRAAEGMSLTQLAFVARAVCDALRAFPNVNSSLDIENNRRILHPYVNIGIAVDLESSVARWRSATRSRVHPMTILGFCYDHRAFDGVTSSKDAPCRRGRPAQPKTCLSANSTGS